jgi:hypothetical protein
VLRNLTPLAVLFFLMLPTAGAVSDQKVTAGDCAISAGKNAVQNIVICVEQLSKEDAQLIVEALTDFQKRNADRDVSNAEFEKEVLSTLSAIRKDLSFSNALEISDFLTRESRQLGLNASRDWILGFKKSAADKGSVISDTLALEDGSLLLHLCYPIQKYENRTGMLYHIDGFGRILRTIEQFAKCPTGKLSKLPGSNAYIPFRDHDRSITVFYNIPDSTNPADTFSFPKLDGSVPDESLDFEYSFSHYFYASRDVDELFFGLTHFVENLNHGRFGEVSMLYFPRRPNEFYSYFGSTDHDGIAITSELLGEDASDLSIHSTGFHFREMEASSLYLNIVGNIRKDHSLTGFIGRVVESSVDPSLQFTEKVFLVDVLAEQDGQDRTFGIDVRTIGTVFRNGKIYVLADATSTIGRVENFYWQSLIFEFSAETLELENLVRIDNARTQFYRDFEVTDDGFYLVGIENLKANARPYPRHNPLAFRNARSNPILTFVSRNSKNRRDWKIEGGRAAEFTEIVLVEDGNFVLLGHAFDKELNSVDRVFLTRISPEEAPEVDLEDVLWVKLPEPE